jgi:hypothetical protein
MHLREIFAPGRTPEEVFVELIPRLHQARLHQFRQFVHTALIVCVRFTDTGRCYTVRLDGQGAEVEKGEMVDFPQVTIEGKEQDWERFKASVHDLVDEADRRADAYAGRVAVTRSMVKAFERFDGRIEVDLTGVGLASPISVTVVLNDYEADSDGAHFKVVLPLETVFFVVRGQVEPTAASRSLQIKGDMGFAVDLGGFFLKYMPTT